MPKETFSIPAGATDRYVFTTNVVKLIVTNGAKWKVPEEKITRLNTSFLDYSVKFSVANNRNTQSPAATAARNAAGEVVVADVNDIYTHYLLNNEDLSTEDREALHIHQTGGGGTASLAPDTTPVIAFTSEEIGALRLVYSDSSKPGTHAKPDNVAFCELRYSIGSATAPATPADCPESANISRSHAAIQFAPEQRGKTIYAFARWVNRNGKTGPWSGMVTALVP